MSFRPQFFQLKLVTVDARSHVGELSGQRRGLGGRKSSPLLVFLEFGAQCVAFGAARCAGAKIAEDLEVTDARADLAIALGAAHLGVEFGNAVLEFGDEIADSNRVLLGLLEPAHRFRLAREKLVDTRRFLEERAAIGRLTREDRVDLTLRNDRVRSRPQTRAHQEVEDVAQPDRRAIDEVLALAGAIGAARDLYFGELDRKTPVGIVEQDRHLGQPKRLARVVAGEDDVFEFAAAQLLLDVSPSTQRKASTRFDLPEPFGPTIAVTPPANSSVVGSANVLKPNDLIFLSFMPAAAMREARPRRRPAERLSSKGRCPIPASFL